MSTDSKKPGRILDRAEVMAMTLLGRTKLAELVKSGDFPAPFCHAGPGGGKGRKKFWLESAVIAYMEGLIAAKTASIRDTALKEPLNHLFGLSEDHPSETVVAATSPPPTAETEEQRKATEFPESGSSRKEPAIASAESSDNKKSCACGCKSCQTTDKKYAKFAKNREMGKLATAELRRRKAEDEALAKDPVKLDRSSPRSRQRQGTLRVSVATPGNQIALRPTDTHWPVSRQELYLDDILVDMAGQSGKAGKAAMGSKTCGHFAFAPEGKAGMAGKSTKAPDRW